MMKMISAYKFLLWLISSTTCLIIVLSQYDPVDNYLIDCGSSQNVSFVNRVFVGDNFYPHVLLSTPFHITLKTKNSNDSILFQTVRIFNQTTSYSFPIKEQGRHWIRLHFFPFVNENYNLSSAKFSVSSQNFTLLKEFQPQSDPVVKEYNLNVTSDVLILTFTPFSNSSFAFINALEVFSIPNDLLPNGARAINLPTGLYRPFSANAMETTVRLSMGNEMVSIENDTLWRVWIPDGPYLMNKHFVEFKSDIKAVNYSRGWPSIYIAPPSVYGTVTMLRSEMDPNILANITWVLDVDPGFDYLIRLHFCDFITSQPERIFLKVYVNSLIVEENLDLSGETKSVFGAPYYLDFVVKSNDSTIRISIAPSTIFTSYANAILNGLEIMKISNPDGSLSSFDSQRPFSNPGFDSKSNLSSILGAVGGVCLALVVIIASMFFLVRKLRRRRVHVHVHSTSDAAVISDSKTWYQFAFATIEEATGNFSEGNVIGFGGFGRVYKGILKDGTLVAVKRGMSGSEQGMLEFRTEIEMLSLFRHRHLVSLIGYCDDHNEMIIIYEYMLNGTLRNHLYEGDYPSLNWRKRLEICIGSAKGLHYLHTGTTNAVIHRDVKSSNILLDENFMAKVSDFGISRNGPELDESHVSTAVKGSFGYLDPEYLTTRQLTEKSDVYSFGVVMLEVLCGRPVVDPSREKEMVNLVEWVMKMEKRGELEKVIDDRLLIKGDDVIKVESLRKFGEIAVKCLSEFGNDRPTMGNVLWNLESALRMQVGIDDEHANGKTTIEEEEEDEGIVFSTTSMGDLDGVGMSRVFSQMVKAEVRRIDDL
ncbi:receptor-like protein kinase HERK 1 [Impatiens glandulifera]|uniref:receptor-like protein kinase HERK 1 n=1 Tax=Impatiens glandulifera TaxID=253017 RepID=UPI001FB166D2|nr:receptor-like protein kinase HERK 1 [Impatiens glandulifera]